MDLKKASEIFWVTFVGQYVEVVCKSSSEEHGQLVVRGYMIDIDSDYYYIGENPFEPAAVVKKDLVGIINLAQETDPATETLANMPVPEKKDEAN